MKKGGGVPIPTRESKVISKKMVKSNNLDKGNVCLYMEYKDTLYMLSYHLL